MTDIKDNGGPAFPTSEVNYEQKYSDTGISMRDYFAAKAPDVPQYFEYVCIKDRNKGADGKCGSRIESSIERECRWRYVYADAMIEARKS